MSLELFIPPPGRKLKPRGSGISRIASNLLWIEGRSCGGVVRPFQTDLTDEQILERLLSLNLERAAEEKKAIKTTKPKVSRSKREDELI